MGHYRLLVNAFADAVHAVRADNAVIAGGMAPFRNDAGDALVIAPLAFMRALLCVSGGRHPKATCATQVKFDIWSHHPYTSGSPTHVAANPDDASISALPEMRRMLSAASRAGHIASSGPVRFWVTEFAWDSNPPDPHGVPERLRSRWIAEALYRMWRAGVSMVTWYKLRDDETSGRPHSATFECGLYYRCGILACDRPKPSLQRVQVPVRRLSVRPARLLMGTDSHQQASEGDSAAESRQALEARRPDAREPLRHLLSPDPHVAARQAASAHGQERRGIDLLLPQASAGPAVNPFG